MFRLFDKLKDIKKALGHLHRHNYQGLARRIMLVSEELAGCQVRIQASPFDRDLLAAEASLLTTYRKLKSVELSMLSQREKIQNLKFGDHPTRFFFSKIAITRQQTVVGRIRNRNGELCEGLEDVNSAFVEYYTWLLGRSVAVQALDNTLITHGRCLAEDGGGPVFSCYR
ncbi:hypothetical protein RND81_13G100300 [Saponaria officinalis]|uniref:Uncharacterized protein n=1 Tax=Saponaria officinalis TaxID=3572 RepID=A0AAW1GZL9_SAPOF